MRRVDLTRDYHLSELGLLTLVLKRAHFGKSSE